MALFKFSCEKRPRAIVSWFRLGFLFLKSHKKTWTFTTNSWSVIKSPWRLTHEMPTTRRLPEDLSLFCKRALPKQGFFSKQVYKLVYFVGQWVFSKQGSSWEKSKETWPFRSTRLPDVDSQRIFETLRCCTRIAHSDLTKTWRTDWT